MNDFEYLYMIRQNSYSAYTTMLVRYNRLLWKLSYTNYHIQKPEGIQINDLYQEANLGFLEALFTYRESKKVGLAHYVKICAESFVLSQLRKCRGMSYRLIDTSFSLDMSIAEDHSLTLQDVIAATDPSADPAYQANLDEARKVLSKIIYSISEKEQNIYQHWLEGYSYREIALLENVTSKQVDNTIQKIKRMIHLHHLT